MILLGTVSLWLALLTALWGAVVGLLALRLRAPALERSAARAPVVLVALLAVTALSLTTALVRFDPRIGYVADHANRTLPPVYRALAIVAAPAGSLLVYVFGAVVSLALLQWTRRVSASWRAAAAVPLLALSAALLAVLLWDVPFAVVDSVPVDGRGFDPRMRDPMLWLGPPLTLVGAGVAGAAWSAAFGTAATSARSDVSLQPMRFAWLIVTVGLIAGAWWSYRTPAWGVGWVPLDGAVLLWLALSLVLALATRNSGWTLPGLALVAAVSLVVLFVVPDDRTARASAFGWTAHGVVVGLIATIPLFMPLLLTRVGRVQLESPAVRGRPRGAAHGIAGAGAALVLVAAAMTGIAGRDRALALAPGETAGVGGGLAGEFTVRQLDVSRFSEFEHVTEVASVQVTRGASPAWIVASERRRYVDVVGRPLAEPVIRPGILRGVLADVHVVLREVAPDGEARYMVRVYPLTNLALAGGILLLVGGVLMVLPGRER